MLEKKQLTEKSWLLLENQNPIGYFKVGKKITFYKANEILTFDNMKEFEDVVGKAKEIKVKNTQNVEVNGFPARHDVVEPVEHENLPLYTAGGKVQFVAGYFTVRYEKSGWQIAHSPKVKTIEENDHVGPFKTRLEAMKEASIRNKELFGK